MTLVLATVFPEGTLVLSDSRATANGDVSEDVLQKIVGINKDVIAGYAGDVAAVTRVFGRAQHFIREKKLAAPADILREFEDAAKEEYQANDAAFSLLVFIRSSGSWTAHRLNPANFSAELIEDIALIGSGSVISPQAVTLYEEIADNDEPLKSKADRIMWSVGSMLGRSGAEGVGGMMQALLLSANGVQTMHTGFVDVDTEGTPESKQIIYEDGQWVQHNHATGDKQVIISPDKLLEQKVHEVVFHNYEVASGNKRSKWYLNTFLTSMSVELDHFRTFFNAPMTAFGTAKFPRSLNVMAYLSLFGPSTEHMLEIVHQDTEGNEVVLCREDFDHTNFPNEYETVQELNIEVKTPGNHHLLCKVDGELVGTKLIYVYGVDAKQNPQEVGVAMQKAHRETEDEALSEPELVYFFVGNEAGDAANPTSLEIKGQFKVAFTMKFPVLMIGYVNFAVRAQKGDHEFLIELFDAASREKMYSNGSTLKATSSSMAVPCEAKIDLKFPKPGLYFLTLRIDGVMKGCIVLMADGYPPSRTYTLPDEEVEKLKQSGLSLLAKRSVQKD